MISLGPSFPLHSTYATESILLTNAVCSMTKLQNKGVNVIVNEIFIEDFLLFSWQIPLL